ncbi:MAG: Ribulose-phosphate 3-epimerase [bacterium]|nr:Ribulose-phosphate 3-epimerase [bacterium]
MIKIAPSILAADFACLREQIRRVEAAGADIIHCDVMDGHFVPNLTFGPLVINAARRSTSLPVEVHLMIAQPERYISAFRQAGADRMIVHAETCPHLHRVVHQVKETGAGVGVALNPATSLTTVEEILPDIDVLLLMTVNPGFGGQTFIQAVTEKIRRARQKLSTLRQEILIEVDGGIDQNTVATVVEAGAQLLVAGSAIFGAADPGQACIALRQQAEAEFMRTMFSAHA